MSTSPRARRRSRWRPTPALAATALVLAACSSGGEPTLDLGDATTTSAAVTVTTSVLPETTLAPVMTAEPTTTPAPTTTEPEPDLEAQIRADFARLIEVRLGCGQDPGNCPIHEITSPGSEAESYLSRLMAERVESGLASVEGSGDFRYEIESVEISSTENVATIVTCHVDSIVLYDWTLDPPAVFDESVISARTRWLLVPTSGRWKWSESSVLEHSVGTATCDA